MYHWHVQNWLFSRHKDNHKSRFVISSISKNASLYSSEYPRFMEFHFGICFNAYRATSPFTHYPATEITTPNYCVKETEEIWLFSIHSQPHWPQKNWYNQDFIFPNKTPFVILISVLQSKHQFEIISLSNIVFLRWNCVQDNETNYMKYVRWLSQWFCGCAFDWWQGKGNHTVRPSMQVSTSHFAIKSGGNEGNSTAGKRFLASPSTTFSIM